jgi:taurine transport system ATP-binding protein
MLSVDRATVDFEATDGHIVHALQEVSLTIGDDEFVVGLGPSGCGKSTLLNAIAGFVPLSSGGISTDGLPIKGPGPDRGVVFQRDTLLPWASTIDNVAFGLKLRGVSKKERRERAMRLLHLVGLQAFSKTPPWQLSGGMRQRVGLARALATDPQTLLMDEPLGALDSLTRENMQELIVRLWAKTRKRVLFITHSIDEALFMGTKILVFSPRPGRIVAEFRSDHVRDFLSGRNSGAVRAQPSFVRRQQEIRALIHADGSDLTLPEDVA